jgi:hypothetical protein
VKVLLAVMVVSVFLGAFVGFPLLAAWDLKRQGHQVAPKLLVLFAGFVVFSLVVDLIAITTLGTANTTTFKKAAPPDRATNNPPGKE